MGVSRLAGAVPLPLHRRQVPPLHVCADILLPAAAGRRISLGMGEASGLAAMLQERDLFDLLPAHGKVVTLDADLPMKHALDALASHAATCLPVWDSHQQRFVDVFTCTDLIDIVLFTHRALAQSGQLPAAVVSVKFTAASPLQMSVAVSVSAAGTLSHSKVPSAGSVSKNAGGVVSSIVKEMVVSTEFPHPSVKVYIFTTDPVSPQSSVMISPVTPYETPLQMSVTATSVSQMPCQVS